MFWINCIPNHTNSSAFNRELLLTGKEMVIWILQYQSTESFFLLCGVFFLLMKWEKHNKNAFLHFVNFANWFYSSIFSLQMYLNTIELGIGKHKNLDNVSGLTELLKFSRKLEAYDITRFGDAWIFNMEYTTSFNELYYLATIPTWLIKRYLSILIIFLGFQIYLKAVRT